MLFTLEALDAQEGDSLILHYGEPNDPRFIVIDGGPKDTYKDSLEPRLRLLKDRWAPGGALPIAMLMVTHVDEDHIQGVLEWTGEMASAHDTHQPVAYDIETLWHNSFDDAGLADPAGLVAGLMSGQGATPSRLVMASIAEGRTLREHRRKLGWPFNTGFRGLVQAPDRDKKTVDWGDGLNLTVICPQAKRLVKLQEKWAEEIEKLRKAGELTTPAGLKAAARYADDSVTNLSSMVVLAEAGGKKILLTGDARGNDIRDGLEGAGLWKKGQVFKVDILKLPHHGSKANAALEFFQIIHADHYVISANGKHGNPDNQTLEWLFEARPEGEFTVWLTNREGEKNLGPRLEQFFGAKTNTHPQVKVNFREEPARSLKVDLLEPVTY